MVGIAIPLEERINNMQASPSQKQTFPQRYLKVIVRLTENKFLSNIFGTFWKRCTIFHNE